MHLCKALLRKKTENSEECVAFLRIKADLKGQDLESNQNETAPERFLPGAVSLTAVRTPKCYFAAALFFSSFA